jgi:hypothetical protein
MKTLFRLAFIFFAITFCSATALHAQIQPTARLVNAGPANLSCSPAPCRLPNVQVTNGSTNLASPANIAVNPSNPLQMAVGVEDSSCRAEGAVYTTNNAGAAWTKACLPFLGVIDFSSVPNLAYDLNGVLYAISHDINLDCGPGSLLETSSTDNGATWASWTVIFRETDLTTFSDSAVVDSNPSSPFANTVYASATREPSFGAQILKVFRSSDSGNTWLSVDVATLPHTPAFDSEGFSHLALASDGTLYLTWMESSNGTATPNIMKFSKSADGGQSWSSPVEIYSATSISPLPNTSVFVENSPVIAVDNSTGPFAGTLYTAFYNFTGSFMQVVISHSNDGGNTWSTPVPAAQPSATHDQYLPWINVDSTGLVGVSWLDRRNDPANVNYRAFVGFSKDGGTTFKRNTQLAGTLSTPTFGMNWAANAWVGSTLYVVWPDTRTGGKLQTFAGGYMQ